MAESITMDPSEVATNRVELDITRWIRWEGLDWGDNQITAYMADMTYGSSPVDYRVPNRTITIPLSLRTLGTIGFESIRGTIQAKIARWQQEGGWLQRISSDGGTMYADVVNAGLTFGGGYGQAVRDYDVDAQLTLECLPDFYGDEVTLSDHAETSAGELIFTDTNIKGNYPARVRMVTDNDQAAAPQQALIWGFRSRHYSSASTAALAYEAEALHPLDSAAKAALTGASGGTVVTHGTLSTGWTPVLGMTVGGSSTYMTHTGNYRWWARYRTSSGTAVAIRGLYDVGDLVQPVDNDPWYHPAGTADTGFYIADLGELRLAPPPVGTHRWAGMIQAKGQIGTENVSIDRVWFQPLDESAGVLRASIAIEEGLVSHSVRDEFNQSAGALAGKVLPVPAGDTWTEAGGAGAFAVDTATRSAQRTATGDTSGLQNGRFGLAGNNVFSHILVAADHKASVIATEAPGVGVVARYTDTNNYLVAVAWQDAAGQKSLSVRKRVAGVNGPILGTVTLGGAFKAAVNYTLALLVDTAGNWYLWHVLSGAPFGNPVAQGQDSTLATAGALDDGLIGIWDQNTGGASTRDHTRFRGWVPAGDAVLHSSQSAELRWDGMFREDSTGTAYGPVSHIEGDLPRLPVSGPEGRTVQTFVKASRGDLQGLPDAATGDDISCRLTYRPCWITVPGT